jgi:hypothetical protein
MSPGCMRNLCCSIFPKKAAIHLIWMNDSQEHLYRSLYISVPMVYNSLQVHCSEFGNKYTDLPLGCVNCGVHTPSYGHVSHMQPKVCGRLLKLYPTSLRCQIRRPVEHLHEIGCCLTIWDFSITSTIYVSAAFSQVFNSSLDHYWGCFTLILCLNIAD